jgi:phosphoribosylformylglycinamidine cyclo-ligase
MTYASSGVDYDPVDRFKVLSQAAARETATMFEHHTDFSEYDSSRGESVYLMYTPHHSIMLSFVEEGLGTKNLIGDAMMALVGKSYYDHIAQDCIAMIVNDKITLGARPLAVAMHLAVGDSKWFAAEKRADDLIRGWANACKLARCVWACGETPVLSGIIMPEAALLSGSAVGYAHQDAELFNPQSIEDGNEIVIVESSGVHANGLSLCRKIANEKRHEHGYLARLPSGRMYGEVLLDPTHIYVGLVQDCVDEGVGVNYAVNITGHGWRKFMRAPQNFEYVIEKLPTQLEIFDFIKTYGKVEEKEMYQTFNMGAGFALYVDEGECDKVVEIAKKHNLRAYRAGFIREAEKKRVIVEERGLKWESESLAIR